jgi:hypothetical protein
MVQDQRASCFCLFLCLWISVKGKCSVPEGDKSWPWVIKGTGLKAEEQTHWMDVGEGQRE